MKKKLLSLLLIATMAVSLVACGTDEKPSKDNNDNKKPTNTVVDATDTPSTDVVETTPAEVETETPEPEKNVITLLSPDGSKVIHEFPIPDGYTVTSDKKSNHVVLEKDDDATIKVELVSGPCAEVFSNVYRNIDITFDNDKSLIYPFGKTYVWQCLGYSYDETQLNAEIDRLMEGTGLDRKYFEQPADNIRVPAGNEQSGFTYVLEYPAEYTLDCLNECDENNMKTEKDFWDLSKHTDYNDYKITSYACLFDDTCFTADEMFTIKTTTTFDANKVYGNTIEEKIFYYINDVSDYKLDKFLEDNFNMYNHTCEHCK